MRKYLGIRGQNAANRLSRAGGRGLILPKQHGGLGGVNVLNTNGQSQVYTPTSGMVGGTVDQFTMSGWWVFAQDTGAIQAMQYLSNASGATRRGWTYLNNATFRIQVNYSTLLTYNPPDVMQIGRTYHIIHSCDFRAGTLRAQMYINGVSVAIPAPTAGTIQESIRITMCSSPASDDGQTQPVDGLCAELYMVDEFIDLAAGGLADFVVGTGDDARPVFLGDNGELPTGAKPRAFYGSSLSADLGGDTANSSTASPGWNGGANLGGTSGWISTATFTDDVVPPVVT